MPKSSIPQMQQLRSCKPCRQGMYNKQKYREAYFCCMKDCNPNVLPDQTVSGSPTATPTNDAPGKAAILNAVMILVAVSAVILC
ncbi:hypothetical protein N7445_008279 [Penicillium cf. griseofulvum]|nr:hypothetical protein N7445_008279 [Penicillium cf. griseofulvum]